MMTEMKLPACYAVIDENEMTYLDGGATIADSDAYKAFLNVETTSPWTARTTPLGRLLTKTIPPLLPHLLRQLWPGQLIRRSLALRKPQLVAPSPSLTWTWATTWWTALWVLCAV